MSSVVDFEKPKRFSEKIDVELFVRRCYIIRVTKNGISRIIGKA